MKRIVSAIAVSMLVAAALVTTAAAVPNKVGAKGKSITKVKLRCR